MKHDRNIRGRLYRSVIPTAFMGVVLNACSPKVVTPVVMPAVIERHDTATKYVTQHDTLIQYREVRDSSSFRQKGDTITLEHWHWERDYTRERLLERRVDSLISAQHDSIPYPIEVPVYIEKPLKKWQKGLMSVGALAVICVFVFLYIKIRERFIR